MSEPLPVILMGLGPIGRSIGCAAVKAPNLNVVAAVDPQHAGRQLSDVLGVDGTRLEVQSDIISVARAARNGVVLHATGSYLHQIEEQLDTCIRARLNVVSTAEELAYPWLNNPDRAEMLARLCDEYAVRVVGTGVNPGFVFERLGSMMSQVAGPITHVYGERVVDAATRRAQLQQKIGAGLSVEEFRNRVANGRFGHVGLRQSAALMAIGCGIKGVDRVDETVEPVVTDTALEGMQLVLPGRVAGVRQVARAFRGDEEVVHLDLLIAIGAQDPRDLIRLKADPPLELLVRGGTPGDSATAWAAIHACHQLMRLPPGLKNVLDLPGGRMS